MRTNHPGRLVTALCTLLLAAGCQEPSENAMVGTLERDRVEIKVESSEPILSRAVRDGAAVQAGDLLLSQDPSRPQARLDQARAERDQAAARLAELLRGPRQEAIRETRARLAAADARRVNALAELERIRGVYSRGLASELVLDQAETAWKTAVADEQAVRENLEAQLTGTTPEELDQAEAALAAAEARVAQAELDFERTELRAPVNGRVDKLLYQVGERPPAGTTVAVVLDDARVFARFYVPEYLRASVQPGKELTVRVDGVADELRGTVRWVSTDASFTPYFALTEHDRSRLSYLAELDLPQAADLPSGVPLVVLPPVE
ncbi:MAG: HlyD family efflux transporter periplasmic adaptor subunit [Xanthomonadales bacterium]|nr:HlyD family efflux transporter periplasmic adaptor subunit [Xanthomonadales bacterium]